MNTVTQRNTPDSVPDSDLDELEDLCTPALDDGFGELDALLKESVASKAEAVRVKEQRKLLASGRLTGESRLHTETLIRSWELKKEWIPVAAVQMFSAQQCSHCGGVHHHFLGIYQRQLSKLSKVSRWIKSDDVANRGLPQETKCEESFAPVCADCSSAFEDA